MRLSRRVVLALVLGAGGGVACGESNAPNTPENLVVSSGSGQSAPTGATLADPLIVLATGSNGQPFPNATVHWLVTTGTATPSAATSVTDSAGHASTILTLGPQIGPVAVRATVAGASPVTFAATATDPCEFVAPYTVGDLVQGSLITADCVVLGGYFTDFYHLDPVAQQGVTTIMSSAAFDTWLELYRLNGPLLAFNDDVDTSTTNSQIDAIIAPGSYFLAPSSFLAGRTGPYGFSVTARPQTLRNCEFVWVTRGVSIADTVKAADCADSAGTSYADAVAILGINTTVLTMTLRSTAVNPYLSLYRLAGPDSLVLVAENDDSAVGTTTDAFITYTVPQSAVFVVFAATAAAGETGAYTLDISSSSTASGTAAAVPGRSSRVGELNARAWPMPLRRGSAKPRGR